MIDKTNTPFLSVNHLGMTFTGAEGSLLAINDISFTLGKQEFTCILGPSGSGKSTLLRLIAGLIKPTRGEIIFDCSGGKPDIGLVFQQASLMPWRTVIQNVLLPLELKGEERGIAEERAERMIHLVGLDGFEEAWPSELSGGMAQRVAIARAFIAEPDLLLLDEPFGALDAITRERMGTELLNIWQGQKRSVIMVTHAISEALLLSDRIIVFTSRPGRITMDMKVEFSRPRNEQLRYTPEFQMLERKLREAIRE